MSQLTKAPGKTDNETIKGFSTMNAIVVLFLMILFMGATTYVLISSFQ